MADRITLLQDAVNEMADHMCNSIGILQQSASKLGFDGEGLEQLEKEENCALFAKLIAQTAKKIDMLIEALPSAESTQEVQMRSIESLEAKNQEAAERLQGAVTEGEQLLLRVQDALKDIAETQLETSRLESLPNLLTLKKIE